MPGTCMLLIAAALAIASYSACAQVDPTVFPARQVRVIVGFTAGSATDITARIFAQKFSEAWGVAVTVDNIPGAGGTVGAARAAKSAPDGYTLSYGANGAMTIAPSLYSRLAYDPTRDFTPISLLLTMPSILAVNNEVPVKSFQDLMALARAQPGKLSYASPGVGTPQHIAGELLKMISGVDITHVPYRGAMFTDVIGGRVTMALQNAGAILPTIRDGRLRALAVTSLKRSANMPEWPTIAESGYPGFEAISWFGLFAPAGTPPAVVAKVHQESLKVLGQADVRSRFAQLALDTAGNGSGELAGIIRSDIGKWAKVIKEAGITASD